MNKYIDAEKLITEIKRLKEKYSNYKAKNETEKCYKGGRLIGYEDALYKIASLQQEQPEADLEKEIIDKYSRDTSTLKTRAQYAKLARYFWNKGYNARKEE